MTRQVEVLAYLKKQGRKGATVKCGGKACNTNDFRKAISDLRDNHKITDIRETNENTGSRYKRYFYAGVK